MRGWSPLISGLLLTPFSLGVALAAPISGRLADRGDGRWLSPVGLGLAAIGLLLLAQVGVNSAPFEIAVWLGISGIGQGIFVSPNTREVMSALPAERSGEASEMVALARVVGQAIVSGNRRRGLRWSRRRGGRRFACCATGVTVDRRLRPG